LKEKVWKILKKKLLMVFQKSLNQNLGEKILENKV